MKKVAIITLAILAAQAPQLVAAKEQTFNVLLAGGSEANRIHIWLSPDGHSYVIDSIVPLEVGGTVCANPAGNPNELICPAPPIAGFEVNAGGGDDKVTVAKKVAIPVTMRGGAGRDVLLGGAGGDKLLGGAENDRLFGWRGDDLLAGGPGNDVYYGGPGNDLIIRGPGRDKVRGGTGNDTVRRFKRRRRAAAPHG